VVVDLARSLRLDRAHRVPSDRGESRLESVRSPSGDGPPGDAICDDTAATASSRIASSRNASSLIAFFTRWIDGRAVTGTGFPALAPDEREDDYGDRGKDRREQVAKVRGVLDGCLRISVPLTARTTVRSG
jgi:hypothetical protein